MDDIFLALTGMSTATYQNDNCKTLDHCNREEPNLKIDVISKKISPLKLSRDGDNYHVVAPSESTANYSSSNHSPTSSLSDKSDDNSSNHSDSSHGTVTVEPIESYQYATEPVSLQHVQLTPTARPRGPAVPSHLSFGHLRIHHENYGHLYGPKKLNFHLKREYEQTEFTRGLDLIKVNKLSSALKPNQKIEINAESERRLRRLHDFWPRNFISRSLIPTSAFSNRIRDRVNYLCHRGFSTDVARRLLFSLDKELTSEQKLNSLDKIEACCKPVSVDFTLRTLSRSLRETSEKGCSVTKHGIRRPKQESLRPKRKRVPKRINLGGGKYMRNLARPASRKIPKRPTWNIQLKNPVVFLERCDFASYTVCEDCGRYIAKNTACHDDHPCFHASFHRNHNVDLRKDIEALMSSGRSRANIL
ncbi:hypothetical protein HDE_02819 [Halotydeus destructor]|nr:hypothetical protein HDE_02819 [Halotydeus destructor]